MLRTSGRVLTTRSLLRPKSHLQLVRNIQNLETTGIQAQVPTQLIILKMRLGAQSMISLAAPIALTGTSLATSLSVQAPTTSQLPKSKFYLTIRPQCRTRSQSWSETTRQLCRKILGPATTESQLSSERSTSTPCPLSTRTLSMFELIKSR